MYLLYNFTKCIKMSACLRWISFHKWMRSLLLFFFRSLRFHCPLNMLHSTSYTTNCSPFPFFFNMTTLFHFFLHHAWLFMSSFYQNTHHDGIILRVSKSINAKPIG